MMECTHKTIGRFSCHTQKSTAIEKTSWMMHHALQVVCGLKGKVMNEQEWGGWSDVVIVDGQEGTG